MAEQVCKCVVSVPHWPEGKPICQACGLSLNDGARPAAPSAAGEPPRLLMWQHPIPHSNCFGYKLEMLSGCPNNADFYVQCSKCKTIFECLDISTKPERGNQPQEGACLLQSSEGREWEQSVKDAGEALRDLAKPTSKAPGVGAEPLSCAECETPVCEHVARDVADLRRQLEQAQKLQREQMELVTANLGDTITCCNDKKHKIADGCLYCQAEAAEQKLAVVATKPPCHVCGKLMTVKAWKCECGAATDCSDPLPSEEAIALTVYDQKCDLSWAESKNIARAVLALLKGENP